MVTLSLMNSRLRKILERSNNTFEAQSDLQHNKSDFDRDRA